MSSLVLETQVYDQFDGPDIDPAKWAVLPVFLPDGAVLPAFEPSAATVVRDGTLSVTVKEFERSHDSHQQADNTKHVLVSTQQFELPGHGVATFAIEQAVTRLGPRRPDDLMLALAAFNVIDPERGLVFDILSNGIEVFAVHEQLSGVPKPAGPAYTYLIRHPFAPIELSPGVSHRCEIEFDMEAGIVRWLVNDTEIYRTAGTPMPERAVLGLGLMSGVLLRDGRSASLQGQGLSASWSSPSVTMTD